MNTIQDIKNLAIKLICTDFTVKDIYGNEHTLCAEDLGYEFKWDNAKCRNGQINYGTKIISLSKPKALVNLHQIDGPITNTILHELAHAFSFHLYGRDGRGHGPKWKSIAKQIGCSGERCTSDYEQPDSKYTLVCETCGNETNMHRRPKLSRSCGKCSPRVYNEKFKMTLKQNY
jgi:predicted SprT family Zn-dependent metalloprotease